MAKPMLPRELYEKIFDTKKSLPSLPEAIDKLREELVKDEEYYYTWQSNIAMAFMDT